MSDPTIRLTILRVLAENKPFAVPAETLLAVVNRLVRPPIKPALLKAHLSWLLDRAMVDFLADPLDEKNADARKWLIKEAGDALLKQ